MEKRILAISHSMNGLLDDDYTLFDDGSILREYDKHTYPGGQNLKRQLSVNELSVSVKNKLLEAASSENKELVKKILNL